MANLVTQEPEIDAVPYLWDYDALRPILLESAEVGVQNLALAFAITFNILQRPDLAVAALIYAVIMPAAALGFVAIARRLLADEVEVVRA